LLQTAGSVVLAVEQGRHTVVGDAINWRTQDKTGKLYSREYTFSKLFSCEFTYLALLAFHSGIGLLQMQIFTVVPGACLKHQSTYDISIIQIILPYLVFIIDELLSVRV